MIKDSMERPQIKEADPFFKTAQGKLLVLIYRNFRSDSERRV